MASSESDVQSIAEFLAGVQGVSEVEVDGLELIAIPEDQQNGLLAKVIEGVSNKGLAVSGLYQEKGRLDEVFRQITEEVDHV